MFSRKVFLKAVRIYRMRPKGEVPNDFWLKGERGVTGTRLRKMALPASLARSQFW